MVGEAFCDVKNLLSPNKFTWGDLMNIEPLVINVTAVGSSDRAERAILGMILAGRFSGQFRIYLWPGGRFEMYEPPYQP